MPIVDVTVASSVPEAERRLVAEHLPDLVAEAVACREEPWIGPPEPGDIDVRFHPRHDLDVGYLRVVVEIRTKLFQSRLDDKQRRADLVRDRLVELGVNEVGVPSTSPSRTLRLKRRYERLCRQSRPGDVRGTTRA